MENIKRLAHESEFPEIRRLCQTLKELLEDYKEDESGAWDSRVFREKIRGLKNHALKNRLFNIL